MLKKELKLLIGRNKTDEVIQRLLSLTEVVNDNDDLLDQVIMQYSRYNDYQKRVQQGGLHLEEQQLITARINAALLDIINKLPDASITPAQQHTGLLKAGNGLVELVLNQEIEDFNSTRKENLIGVISAILNIQKTDVLIRQIAQGSLKIKMELPLEKATLLTKIFLEERSNQPLKTTLKIQSIVLEPPAAPAVKLLDRCRKWLASFWPIKPDKTGLFLLAIIMLLLILYKSYYYLNNSNATSRNPARDTIPHIDFHVNTQLPPLPKLESKLISGFVKDARGNAIDGVVVSCLDKTDTTKVFGMYTLFLLFREDLPDSILISFKKPGYYPVERYLQKRDTTSKDMRVILRRRH